MTYSLKLGLFFVMIANMKVMKMVVGKNGNKLKTGLKKVF